MLETAMSDILIVDPYVGIGTLDCLRGVCTAVRLLTGKSGASIEAGFSSALADSKKEGFSIDVRESAMQHDRHLVFNDRCWLVGSSLKDAGKKAFHCIEIVDDKADVIARLEAKWSAGARF